jgi:hypothetical protein
MRMEYPSHAEPQRRRSEPESEPIHHSADAVLYHRRAEVDEESQSEVKQPKTRQELLGMYAGNLLDGLQLHNHAILSDEIRAKTFVEPQSVEHNGDRFLAFDLQAPLLEFARSDDFVDRFQESWTKRRVEMISGVDDRARDQIEISHLCGSAALREAASIGVQWRPERSTVRLSGPQLKNKSITDKCETKGVCCCG